MNEQEKFKKQAEETVGLLTDSMKMLSSVETVFKDQLDLANPISRKDVTVDGKNIFVSLTKSNQVVFNFASADHAQEFYNRIEFSDPRSMRIKFLILETYLKNPWYKRIFKKKPL